MKERLQKLLSAAGVCSRRTAEIHIAAGRVTVNGETALLGQRADPEQDDIRVGGVPLAPKAKPVYILLNKPRGYVTTLADEKGRKTVAELVKGCGARVYPVGRLDLNSEGLLLLTNDGGLAQRLLHPRYETPKIYHVWVRGETEKAVERLSKIRDLEGEPIRPACVQFLCREGDDAVKLSVAIHEGKNRQIRRMCSACGLEVKRLRRVGEHTLSLGGLRSGQWRYLTPAEVRELKKN